jgi:putative ATPase
MRSIASTKRNKTRCFRQWRTENPYFEVIGPLRSRSTLFRLEPLDRAALEQLAERALVIEEMTATAEALEHLLIRAGGDGRQILTALEVAMAMAQADSSSVVETPHVEAALGASALRYGEDEHYDVISAFIKSMRGSDPDATLHWLARMLEAGEDARFIARRMVIAASEDVGMADPMALVVATAAAQALEFVGLPEAQLNLAHAAVYIATAPKSNRSAIGIWNARDDVQKGPLGEVPAHLRDSHYQGAQKLGHGAGYQYPHEFPNGWVAQQYLPDVLRDRRYYEPSANGFEAELEERVRDRR